MCSVTKSKTKTNMRQLSKIETYIFLVGAVLMTIGAGCCAFLFIPKVFSWVYFLGAILFVTMQARQKYEGDKVVLKRLRRILLASGVFLIIAGVLLVDTHHHFLASLMAYQDYIAYIYNKWVVFLLAGALLQLYSTHRISNELQKD